MDILFHRLKMVPEIVEAAWMDSFPESLMCDFLISKKPDVSP